MVTTVTNDTFKTEVLDSEKTVLVDFWAAWCGPCRMLSPVIDEIAQERNDIKVCKVNIDEASDLASKYGVMSVPTLIIFNNGEIINQLIGAVPKDQIIGLIDNE